MPPASVGHYASFSFVVIGRGQMTEGSRQCRYPYISYSLFGRYLAMKCLDDLNDFYDFYDFNGFNDLMNSLIDK